QGYPLPGGPALYNPAHEYPRPLLPAAAGATTLADVAGHRVDGGGGADPMARAARARARAGRGAAPAAGQPQAHRRAQPGAVLPRAGRQGETAAPAPAFRVPGHRAVRVRARLVGFG